MSNEEIVKLIQDGVDVQKNMETLYNQNEKFIISVIKRKHYGYICNRMNKRKRKLDRIDEKEKNYSVGVIEYNELLQEAYIGLVKAVEGYNPEAGASFLTYFEYWIIQMIKRFLDNCGETIRVPVHMQAKISAYNKTLALYLSRFGREPTKEEFATCLRMTVKEVEKLEDFMFRKNVTSLDIPILTAENEEVSLSEVIQDDTNVEQQVIEDIAAEKIKGETWAVVSQAVNQRMLKVLKYRYKDGLTLEQTGDKMGVSREVVRNLENNVFRRLKSNSKTKRLMELIA